MDGNSDQRDSGLGPGWLDRCSRALPEGSGAQVRGPVTLVSCGRQQHDPPEVEEGATYRGKCSLRS